MADFLIETERNGAGKVTRRKLSKGILGEMNGRGNSRGISTAIFGETSEEIYGRIYEENFVDISKGNLRTRLPLDISTTRKIFSKEHRRNAGWDH